MIPKHEDLGHIVTTDTEWFRPVAGWWEEEDKRAFEDEHGVAFCVVEQASEYGDCTWGFSKAKPYDVITEENGDAEVILVCWGFDTAIRFANGSEIVKQIHWPDNDHLPIEYDETSRCEGFVKTGQRAGERCTNTAWGYCGQHTKQREEEK